MAQAIISRLEGVDLYDVVLEYIAQGRYFLSELSDSLGAGGLITTEFLLQLLYLGSLGEELADQRICSEGDLLLSEALR